MAELKRTFTEGRMNKDLDERLVPNGQYRDAWNDEILNSDGSNVGSVQTCLGNSMISDIAPSMGTFDSIDVYSSCVGHVVDDKTNRVYYLISGAIPRNNGTFINLVRTFQRLRPFVLFSHAGGHNFVSSDMIVEYDAVTGDTLPVMVDIYNVRTELNFISGWCTALQGCIAPPGVGQTFGSDDSAWSDRLSVVHTSGLRIGMEIEMYGAMTGDLLTQPNTIITAIPSSRSIKISKPAKFSFISDVNLAHKTIVNAFAPRVLNFNKKDHITGINIIDDMIFWTDNNTEPKKVNITRGKQGSIPGMGICRTCVFNPNLENPFTYPGTSAVINASNLGPTWVGTTHTELVVEENVITDYSTNGVALNPGPVGTNWGIQEYVKEEHITVIKKSPLTPPKLNMYDTVIRFDADTRALHSIVNTDFHNWVGINPNDPSGTNIVPPVGMTSIIWNEHNTGAPIAFFDTNSDFRVGDVLLLTDDFAAAIDSNGNPLPFSGDDVKIKLRVISSNSTAETPTLVQSPNNGNLEVRVLYMDDAYVSGTGGVTWYIRLEDKPQSLYELKFPKFAYRYKYEDGEYSSFSPFSETAFLPQAFEYDAVKGYNKGMTNGLKQLFIKDFIPPNIPLDVVEVEILYKESDSPNIYTIRSFNRSDKEWNRFGTGNYKGEFEIKDDLIHAAVASDQLLRPWDNVPKKSLAQEVTGNRLVYGNYTQNYDIKELALNVDTIKPSFKAVIENSVNVLPETPQTSLKSMRTYQLGVVYKDVYGRETPVLSHPSGVIKVDSSNAILGNSIDVKLDTPHPYWADSFKYFIKEVSNEYYNLAMDRWYDADYIEYDGNKRAIWLAFPSDDRNKVDEETTLILKKSEGASSATNSGFVETTPRYKILAIENEAPDFIKTTMETMGEIKSGTDGAGGIGAFHEDQPADEFGLPYTGYKQIRIKKNDWEDSKFSSLQSSKWSTLTGSILDRGSSLVLRFEEYGVGGGGMIGQWYNISNISFSPGVVSSSEEHYIVTIDDFFGDDLFPFVGGSVNQSDVIANIKIVIAKKTVENRPEFDGRFFVKIESDGELKEFMGLQGSIGSTTNWVTNDTLSTHFLYGPVDTAINGANGYAFSTFTSTTGDYGVTSGWDMTQYPGWECQTTYYYSASAVLWEYNQPRMLHVAPPGTAGASTYYPAAGMAGLSGNTPHMNNVVTNSAAPGAACPLSLAAHASGHGDINDQVDFSPPFRWKDHWEDLHNAIGTTVAVFSGPWGGTTSAIWAIDSEPAFNLTSDNGVTSPWLANVAGSGKRAWRIAEHGFGADIGSTKISISLFCKLYNNNSGTFELPAEPWIQDAINNLSTVGTKFRFAGDNDNIVYEIGDVKTSYLANYDFHTNVSAGYEAYDHELHRYRFDLDLIEPGSAANPIPKAIGQQADATFLTGSVNGFADPGVYSASGTHTSGTYSPCDYSDISTRPTNYQASDSNPIVIEFVTPDVIQNESQTVVYSKNPAIWETEPKEDVGLDIYYEIGQAYPINMCDGSEELYIQVGAKVSMHKSNPTGTWTTAGWFNNQEFVDQNLLAFPTINLSGTTIVNSTHAITAGTANFTQVGGQEVSFNQVGGNANLTLEAPVNPALEWALDNGVAVTVTDWVPGTNIPIGTQITNFYKTVDGKFVVTLNNLVPVPNAASISVLPGSVLRFGMGANSPNPFDTYTDATVATIVGCAGDATLRGLTTELRLTVNQVVNAGDILLFENPDGTNVTATVAFDSLNSTTFANEKIYLEPLTHKEKQKLNYYNCYTYGNGIESNRIRDLFNAVKIDKGVKASTTLAEQYKEEHRKNGLIFSGLYNSMNGVNRLNQFLMAEDITKDLNPEYGSIQKLHQRDTDLVTLCEDKVLKVLSHKDALFNADDTKNITATQNVLGNAVPFVGEYGISKNPESFAHEGFRAYFTDQERGAVLRLSRDGLTPISDAGMKDWFADNLPTSTTMVSDVEKKSKLLGSYDRRKSLYNLTVMKGKPALDHGTSNFYNLLPVSELNNHAQDIDFSGDTISFSEKSGGWVSFKSFSPEIAFSLNSEYYTGKYGWLWRHHEAGVDRNSLYSIKLGTLDNVDGVISNRSYITFLFNDLPSTIKSFNTLNYEGSQSKIHQDLLDGKHYNNQPKKGWYVNEIVTDQQVGTLPGREAVGAPTPRNFGEWEGEFLNKEGKWFNYTIGKNTILTNGRPTPSNKVPLNGTAGNIDTQEFAVQGMGFPRSTTYIDNTGASTQIF